METNGTDTLWFYYDASGSLTGFELNETPYFYVKNAQGDIIAITDASGTKVVEYLYDSWGKLISTTGSLASTLGVKNPYRYRGYRYDTETGLYYLQSRYYDPFLKRFINADTTTGQIGNIQGHNMFAYAFNNPIMYGDSCGNWPKWVTGALNVVGGALQVAAGIALGATVGWTGIGAAAAGLLIVNGTATSTQGVGQIVNDITDSNTLCEENLIKKQIKGIGRALGGDTGALIAGTAYDSAVAAASIYSCIVGLQQIGLAPIKVNINNVVNNPLDEFVTLGPADGVVSNYCRTIPQNGYGKIYVTELGDGIYQLADGHHRVAALRKLGEEAIYVYLTK